MSREEQVRDGVSLDAQRDRIAAYAVAKGLELVAVLADEGASGKDLNRSQLQELLARCDRREVQHVIVWKLDRLTRRTPHLLRLVEDLFLARGIELHSVMAAPGDLPLAPGTHERVEAGTIRKRPYYRQTRRPVVSPFTNRDR